MNMNVVQETSCWGYEWFLHEHNSKNLDNLCIQSAISLFLKRNSKICY